MAGLCATPLWDNNVTWDTPDPDFTPCFQKVILGLLPCYFLFLVAPFRIFQLYHEHTRLIKWSPVGSLRLVVLSVLVCYEIYELIYATALKSGGENIPPIDFIAPICVLFTLVLVFLIMNFERIRGKRTSGVLVIFWLLYVACGAIRLRSILKEAIQIGNIPPSTFVLYPCVLFAMLLSNYMDDKPAYDDGLEGEKPCPEGNASFLSRITFSWFTGLVVLGYKRALTESDLWSLNKEDSTEYVAHKFNKNWNLTSEINAPPINNGDVHESSFMFKEGSAILTPYVPCVDEVKTAKRSLFSAMVRTYIWFFLLAAVFKFAHDCLMFVSPQLLKLLIQFTNSDEYEWRGYFYAAMLLVIALFQSVLLHQYFHATFLLGMRLRSTIIAVIYRKTLRLSNSAKRSSTVGEIVNLMSVDAQRFMDLTTYLHTIWSGPFQIALALYFLWQTLGPSALAGIAVMVLLIPINAVIAHKIRQYQVQQMALKDSRIKLMNEILNGIKVLKLYAWEGSFQDKVLAIRNDELKVLKKTAIMGAVTSFFWTCAPVLVSLTTFAVYVLSSPDNILDAEKAFVSLALFNILRFPLSMVPNVITSMVQANVSLKRLQKFVDSSELDTGSVDRQDRGIAAVSLENASFGWDEGQSILSSINLTIGEGSLIAIVGAVGAGKSSILAAMLGEMEKTSGSVHIKGSVAYVAQQAWIQNETLQNNILFNKTLNQKLYNKVVEACALKPDFDILPAGDKTEIGEKGINLSGGQKQRVSLARAVYQDTDIYLLDDPLSAVDSHVGKHLFDNVIGPEGMLKSKTRVLVTHGIGFLPQVDKIIVLVNGKVSEVGSFVELMKHNGAFAEFLRNYLTEELKDEDGALEDTDVLSIREEIMSQLESVIDDTTALQRQVSKLSERIRSDSELSKGSNMSLSTLTSSPIIKRRHKKSDHIDKEEEEKLLLDQTKKKDEDKLVQAETVETGRVKLSVFMTYVRAVGPVLSILVIIFYILYNAASIYSNIWLSQWSNDAKHPNITADTEQRDLRLGVYGALGVLQGILIMICAVITTLAGMLVSEKMFNNFLAHLLRNPIQFFEQHRLGVILNRCSDDMAELDFVVPFTFRSMLMVVMSVIGTAAVIVYSTPWAALSLFVVAPAYVCVQPLYCNIFICVFLCFICYHNFLCGIFVLVTAMMRLLGSVKAAKILHSGLLTNIVSSPMSFFDTTPSGRIVNRFSKDVDTLDVMIPMIIGMFLMCLFQTISTLLVISISTPMFLTCIVPLLFCYYFVQRFYVATSRQLKRLESISRSPIYSHFSETITGAVTIRAFGQETRFIRESQTKVDNNQISYYPSIVSNRWLAIRLEIVGNLIIFFASLFAVLGRDHLSPGTVGLSITYAMNVTQTLNWMVRMTCELETNIVAVERIKEYTETPTEAEWIIEGSRPKPNWPDKGVVEFRDYKVRYREGLDLVLKGIDCTIQQGEKVGIVGRTGAGKSSLTLALFRIIEAAEGKIIVDGVDIAAIGLHDLRSRLTIIPQDPVLFSGTLRMNLDPFDKHTDEEIWSALEHAHLKAFVTGLADGLQHMCSEGGENLSVGQRQLVCLARALLRKTQVLILDEATAAVDLETDDLIQATIRTEFAKCTVLTIAHRLNTIMDYTRIMVLDAGRICEFDSPQSLLKDDKSVFYGMAKDAGLV